MPTATTSETRKFGVEIESIGVSERRMEDLLRANRIRMGYLTGWEIHEDCSLSPRGAYEDCCEVVSPILSGEAGFAEVKRVALLMSQNGATVNRSCGLHVHVDARGLTGTEIVTVSYLYQRYQTFINNVLAASRHDNRFCRTGLYDSRHLCSIVENGFMEDNDYRYMVVNYDSLSNHRTIEFRQHHGSVNGTKIVNWIKFCLGLVEKACTIASDLPVLDSRYNRRVGRDIAFVVDDRPRRRGNHDYAERQRCFSILNCRRSARTGREMSALWGHSLTTTRRWLNELVQIGVVECVLPSGYRVIPSGNRSREAVEALNVWLGHREPQRSVGPELVLGKIREAVEALPRTHEELFSGMTNGAALHRYYTRRAAEFGNTWE